MRVCVREQSGERREIPEPVFLHAHFFNRLAKLHLQVPEELQELVAQSYDQMLKGIAENIKVCVCVCVCVRVV